MNALDNQLALGASLAVHGRTLELTLINPSQGSLDVMDVIGHSRMQLANGTLTAGVHQYALAGLRQGIYLVRYLSGDRYVSAKIVIAK